MTPVLFIGAALAGGMGAAVRYLADLAVTRLAGRRLPWGIVLVNITGSFVLGGAAGLAPEAYLLVGAGFLGGYTTFSTAMLDVVELWRNGARPASVAALLGTAALSILAAACGVVLAGAFS